MIQTKLQVAAIEHRYGTNFYVQPTREALFTEIANDFCREYWEAEKGDDNPVPENDEECVNAYFDEKEDEFIIFDEVVVPLPPPPLILPSLLPEDRESRIVEMLMELLLHTEDLNHADFDELVERARHHLKAGTSPFGNPPSTGNLPTQDEPL